jgi:hypothetical protein
MNKQASSQRSSAALLWMKYVKKRPKNQKIDFWVLDHNGPSTVMRHHMTPKGHGIAKTYDER